MDEVIFASRSSDHFFTSLREFLGFAVEDSTAILGGFGFDNVIDSGLDLLRWVDVNVDIGVLEMLIAVMSGGVRRALGSDCARFR